MEPFEKVLGLAGRLTPVPAIAIALAAGAALYLPEDTITNLGISEFRVEHRGLLGWSLLLSCAYVGATLVWFLRGIVAAQISAAKEQAARVRHLKELTQEEKGYLIEFINGKNTIHCSISDGIANGLEAKGIIYRASNIARPGSFPFNLQPWAREHLEKDRHLLDGYIERGR